MSKILKYLSYLRFSFQGLLGLRNSSASDFVSTIWSVFSNIRNTTLGDAALGIGSVVVLLLLRKLKDIKAPENATKSRRMLHTTLWLIATARNALIVLIASVVAFYCESSGSAPFILTGTVRSGLPNLQLPSTHTTVLNANGTIVEMNLGGMVNENDFPLLESKFFKFLFCSVERVGLIDRISSNYCRTRQRGNFKSIRW